MSIYAKSTLKRIGEEKMNADLEKFWEEDWGKSSFTSEELERYVLLLGSVPEEDWANWNFYLSDDVYEEIIEKGVGYDMDLMDYYSHPDYDMEMCLEEAKSMRIIYGFVRLSKDLWVIKDY